MTIVESLDLERALLDIKLERKFAEYRKGKCTIDEVHDMMVKNEETIIASCEKAQKILNSVFDNSNADACASEEIGGK